MIAKRAGDNYGVGLRIHRTNEQDEAISRWHRARFFPLELEKLHAGYDGANEVDVKDRKEINQVKGHGEG